MSLFWQCSIRVLKVALTIAVTAAVWSESGLAQQVLKLKASPGELVGLLEPKDEVSLRLEGGIVVNGKLVEVLHGGVRLRVSTSNNLKAYPWGQVVFLPYSEIEYIRGERSLPAAHGEKALLAGLAAAAPWIPGLLWCSTECTGTAIAIMGGIAAGVFGVTLGVAYGSSLTGHTVHFEIVVVNGKKVPTSGWQKSFMKRESLWSSHRLRTVRRNHRREPPFERTLPGRAASQSLSRVSTIYSRAFWKQVPGARLPDLPEVSSR